MTDDKAGTRREGIKMVEDNRAIEVKMPIDTDLSGSALWEAHEKYASLIDHERLKNPSHAVLSIHPANVYVALQLSVLFDYYVDIKNFDSLDRWEYTQRFLYKGDDFIKDGYREIKVYSNGA
jgi:hypothetical protein